MKIIRCADKGKGCIVYFVDAYTTINSVFQGFAKKLNLAVSLVL
jgi:hypothetical protein